MSVSLTERERLILRAGLQMRLVPVSMPRETYLKEIREERIALRIKRSDLNREIKRLQRQVDELSGQIEDLNDEENAITAQFAAGR